MNFSAWSIRNPIAPLLAFFLLIYVGISSFYSLPITRFPNIDVPIIAITVNQSGAAPAELEVQVTKEIEDYVLVGSRAWGIGLSPDQSTIYVANGLSDDVTVIDADTRRVTKSIPVGRVPHSVLVDD